jgi:two-component system, sensor histidine kinase YesM
LKDANSRFFKNNLTMFLVPLLIPLLILGSFSILSTQRYVEDQINKSNLNLLKQTRDNLELIINELDSLNLNFSTNPEILLTLKSLLMNSKPALTLDEYQTLSIIKNFINAPTNARPYIHSIYVYLQNPHQKFITTSEGLTDFNNFYDTSWYQSYLHQTETNQIWTQIRTAKRYLFEKPTKLITIYRRLYSSGVKHSSGVIVLNIYASYIENLFGNLETYPGQSILIIDENNKILLKNKVSVSGINFAKIVRTHRDFFTFKAGGRFYVASQLYSTRYRWRYISIVPQKILYQVPSQLKLLTIFLLLISFLLGLILTYWLTKRNYQQIHNIISIIDAAKQGKPLPSLPTGIGDEYSYITHNILKTFIEQNYLKIQLSERKYKLRTMELLALQSQINPHFLFNTLETIKWKIIGLTKRPNSSSKMLENLSIILKYSLETPGKPVTLAEEIQNTKNYVEIQKVRYKNKFKFIWELNEEVLNYQVIRLILQPLIENCIYHGIKERPGKSMIKVKIHKKTGYLKITVIDNGIGMNRDKLFEIRRRLENEDEFTEHIGIFNTNKRIQLTYGSEYGLKINSKFNFGSVVYLKIPFSNSTFN